MGGVGAFKKCGSSATVTNRLTGKTMLTAAVVREEQVRKYFQVILLVQFSQQPKLMSIFLDHLLGQFVSASGAYEVTGQV
jgi:hypothetical protein